MVADVMNLDADEQVHGLTFLGEQAVVAVGDEVVEELRLVDVAADAVVARLRLPAPIQYGSDALYATRLLRGHTLAGIVGEEMHLYQSGASLKMPDIAPDSRADPTA